MSDHILQFAAGTFLLYYGADWLITGSRKVASKFQLSPILVGITLVAFGTSLPELIVSIFANIQDQSGIVLGNVIGSNITNIGLVLGVIAFLYPIGIAFNKIRFDIYFLLVITLTLFIMVYFEKLVFWHGILFILMLCGYCWYLIRQNFIRADIIEHQSDTLHSHKIILLIILGIICLGIGAHIFIMGAIGIATALGVSSLIIGMSLVALGTSLPELAASLAAAKHKETEFIIGNIIGSNIINIIVVLGIAVLIKPISTNFVSLYSQTIFMIILTIGLLWILKFQEPITRFSAGLLVIIYGLFLYFNFQINTDLAL